MKKKIWIFLILLVFISVAFLAAAKFFGSVTYYSPKPEENNINSAPPIQAAPIIPPLNTALYDQKLEELANNPIPKPIIPKKDKEGNIIEEPPPPVKPNLWPVKTAYPDAGAILPFSRIVAYYGNFYSTKMGILGEYPEDQVLARLQAQVQEWQAADPSTPVIPAIHYIAVVAQGSPGKSGKYRARMPDSEIQKAIDMAAKINALVFLDVQVGCSDVQTEVPLLEKYLKLPNVHLGIDPEFSMKGCIPPGRVIGTLDASDINFVSDYLSGLVKEYNLNPKILIIHRFTENMVTNYKEIKTSPEVQIVMNMDGWGDAAHKKQTYNSFIYKEPVQFTGFKIFFKNDILTPGTSIMSPQDLLKLRPIPVYIQYQ